MKLVGILNITPDSCSDGGLYLNPDQAVCRAQQMLSEGADFIDIGGESTRPGAKSISPEEEQRRILPVIQRLIQEGIRNLSVDTRHASTAKLCLKAGVPWLNDISALTYDAQMLEVAKDFEQVTLMHMRGLPANMQDNLEYDDLIKEIKNYLYKRKEATLKAGIKPEQLSFDPGLGFGKSTAQCCEILARLKEFQELGSIYIGPSRKNFIGELTGIATYSDTRDYGTIGAILAALKNGAQFARIHHVKAAKDALTIFLACQSRSL